MLIKLIAFAAVALSTSFTYAGEFTSCPQNFFQGKSPTILSGDLPGNRRELCFEGFAVMHSGVSKTPMYSAEYITRASMAAADAVPRVDKFYEEARVPSADRAKLSDYKGSGLDRGHMYPAASAPTVNSNAQCFSLANMVPQSPKLNRGIWAKSVEAATRKYAERATNGVYVITGPIHVKPVTTIGLGGVWVPSSVFKLVYDPALNKAWAHVLPNLDSATMVRPITYQELVKQTGIEFLPKGTNPSGI